MIFLRDYFCGWYFKCQSDKHTIAVIPAYHRSDNKQTCSIQLITDDGAWNIDFPYESFKKQRGSFDISIDNNRFSNSGISFCFFYNILFTTPNMITVRSKLAAAAEIMNAACYKVVSQSIACIKVSSIR